VWATRTAAFTLTDRAGELLLVRHERLRVAGWEPPGGHVEGGETAEQGAVRETAEETGVDVEVGRLVATCVHEWAEREERRVLLFFAARAVGTGRPRPPPGSRRWPGWTRAPPRASRPSSRRSWTAGSRSSAPCTSATRPGAGGRRC